MPDIDTTRPAKLRDDIFVSLCLSLVLSLFLSLSLVNGNDSPVGGRVGGGREEGSGGGERYVRSQPAEKLSQEFFSQPL